MSEKDIKKCLTDADLDNVSGGVIETKEVPAKFLGKNTVYRANFNGKKGEWRSSKREALKDEQEFGLEYLKEADASYGQVIQGKLKDQ